MRSKYGDYPEYHTSLDNLGRVVTAKGLEGSYNLYQKILTLLENNYYPMTKILCEPQLGKRNLYSKISKKDKKSIFNNLASWIRMNLFIPDARIGWLPFAIKSAKKIVPTEFVDLGQGMLELVEEVYQKINKVD